MTAKKDFKQVFLGKLSRSPNVTAAAKAAGYSRKHFYELRKTDSDFAEAWQDALDQSLDTAEGELYRRAVRGVVKKVFYQDKQIDTLHEYSDTLLIFMLKSHRPEIYRETTRSELTGRGGGPIEYHDVAELSDEDLARIAATSRGGVTKAQEGT